MPDPDSAVAQRAIVSAPGETTPPGVTDAYIRGQLELRRAQLKTVMSNMPVTEETARAASLAELLLQVDAAIERVDAGRYGICDVCHDTIEKERLIADPLTTLCLDHLTGEEQRALERDLELARRIQRGLLPDVNVRIGDWRIHFRYKPAGVVSGDYCDVIAPASEANGLIFLLGDVAGKGVAAALLMSHLHAMFRSLAGIGLELDKLVETANRVFCESTLAGQYATLICGRTNGHGQVEIASAGHLPALLVSRDGVHKISSTGLPLGMFASSRYFVHRVGIEPSDSVVLFTDGISEATSVAGHEFGVDGLSSAVVNRRGLPADELAAACMRDLEVFGLGARQADDQTLMVVQRTAGDGRGAPCP